MNTLNTKSLSLLVLVIGVLLAPLLAEHFEILTSRRHYQWWPILAVILLFISVVKWRKAEPAETYTPRWVLFVGLLFSLLVLAVAYLYYTGWLAMAALICVVGVLFAYLSNYRKVEGLFGVWMLLFLFVRMPHQIEGRLLIALQNLSAKLASIVIDYSGSYHVVQGDFIVIDGYELELDFVCNGYFSVISMLVVTALYGFWKKYKMLHMALLLPAAVVAAVTVNIVRVATVAIVYAKTGEDIMLSHWLYLMTAVSFVLGFLFILSYNSFLIFLFSDVRLEGAKKAGTSLAKIWNKSVGFSIASLLRFFTKPASLNSPSRGKKLMTMTVVVCLVALTVFESVVMYYKWGFGDYQTYFMHDKEALAEVDSEKVSFLRPGWEVISVEKEEREMSSIWGAYSTVWRMKYHDTLVIFALDYPFDKWHDVKRCYTNLGWQVQTEGIVDLGDSTSWGASETELVLPTGDYGFILCSHCDHLGEIVQPKPTDHQFSMVLYYLHPKQWTAPFGVSVDKNQNTFYQTQMMVTAAFELDEPTKSEIRAMYREFREQTRALIEQESVK